METLRFRFAGTTSPAPIGHHALVGVVASGNLEILIEAVPLDGAMELEIITAAKGFAPIWEAVLGDFAARHHLADLRIAINDVGATPAVVTLRLEQAIEALREGEGA